SAIQVPSERVKVFQQLMPLAQLLRPLLSQGEISDMELAAVRITAVHERAIGRSQIGRTPAVEFIASHEQRQVADLVLEVSSHDGANLGELAIRRIRRNA